MLIFVINSRYIWLWTFRLFKVMLWACSAKRWQMFILDIPDQVWSTLTVYIVVGLLDSCRAALGKHHIVLAFQNFLLKCLQPSTVKPLFRKVVVYYKSNVMQKTQVGAFCITLTCINLPHLNMVAGLLVYLFICVGVKHFFYRISVIFWWKLRRVIVLSHWSTAVAGTWQEHPVLSHYQLRQSRPAA